MNTEQSKDRGSEIIGSAHFSMGRAIVHIIGGCIAFLLCVIAGFGALFMGEMLVSAFLFLIVPLMFPGLLDLLSSDRIIFYGNRVTKIWHILKPKTIYFSSAKVQRNRMSTDPAKWEITENGPSDWVWGWYMQRQILYEPRFFFSEASQEIHSLLTELAGDEIESGRYTRKDRVIATVIPFAILLCVLLFIYFCNSYGK